MSLLISFDGFVQLTVKAFHDEELALKDLLRERSEIRSLRDQTAGRSGSYHSQLRLGEAVAAGLEALASADATMLHAESANWPNASCYKIRPESTRSSMQPY